MFLSVTRLRASSITSAMRTLAPLRAIERSAP
jgi:hypothetical protein